MEVIGQIFNEGTGLVLPAIYTFIYRQKYTKTDISEIFDFLRLLSSLNFEKMGCTRIRASVLNRSNTVFYGFFQENSFGPLVLVADPYIQS